MEAIRTLNNLFEHGSADLVGELLRELTFPENCQPEHFGCYTTFEVRKDAAAWSPKGRASFWRYYNYCDAEDMDEYGRMGSGYTYEFMGLTIDVCWYWDGDGCLAFRVSDSQDEFIRRVVNTDCKKDYCWEELEKRKEYA